jgi:hypothetical protein
VIACLKQKDENAVAHLLRARAVEPEKQLLQGIASMQQ